MTVFVFRVQNLSLRYNSITEKGAALLGEALGGAKKCNTKLLTLNLNGNRVSDAGAQHLAKVHTSMFILYINKVAVFKKI